MKKKITVLALWQLNVGNIYADQGVLVGALPPAEGLLGPRRRLSAQLAVGDPQLLAALAPNELEEVADRAARLQAYITARSDFLLRAGDGIRVADVTGVQTCALPI